MGLVIKELRKNLTIRIKTYGAGDKRVAQRHFPPSTCTAEVLKKCIKKAQTQMGLGLETCGFI
jgi:hypothetical protein